MSASVIVCAHNPRREFLSRVLKALEKQTLTPGEWELLLVDNASAQPLETDCDLSWHSNARHLRVEQLGLTPARLRGIAEASSELLIFVDDDNVLAPDYLAVASRMMADNPLLGVLGAGRILPEYESEPVPELRPFLHSLALRDERRAHYSNETRYHTPAIPYGAGLCIRRQFALEYVESCRRRPAALGLDRCAHQLLSGGDIDLALHACREGSLAGVVPELTLVHLIPSSRLELDYFVRLSAGHATANYHLARLWGWNSGESENPVLKWLRYWRRRVMLQGLARRIYIAIEAATDEAREFWRHASHESASPPVGEPRR